MKRVHEKGREKLIFSSNDDGPPTASSYLDGGGPDITRKEVVLHARFGVHCVQALHSFPVQRFATGKGAIFDGFQTVRECNVFQVGAPSERAVRDFFYA